MKYKERLYLWHIFVKTTKVNCAFINFVLTECTNWKNVKNKFVISITTLKIVVKEIISFKLINFVVCGYEVNYIAALK